MHPPFQAPPKNNQNRLGIPFCEVKVWGYFIKVTFSHEVIDLQGMWIGFFVVQNVYLGPSLANNHVKPIPNIVTKFTTIKCFAYTLKDCFRSDVHSTIKQTHSREENKNIHPWFSNWGRTISELVLFFVLITTCWSIPSYHQLCPE